MKQDKFHFKLHKRLWGDISHGEIIFHAIYLEQEDRYLISYEGENVSYSSSFVKSFLNQGDWMKCNEKGEFI